MKDCRVVASPWRRFLPIAALLAMSMHASVARADLKTPAVPAFTFNSMPYFARWSGGSQHEFTPAAQEDLDKWSDMFTANIYKEARDGDGLAKIANAVLGNYQGHGAKILRTDSVPRTATSQAEHLIVALFAQPTFIEIAFNRFMFVEGTGCSLTYSHRIYGAKAGDAASAWLSANGQATEKALMTWRPPALAALGG
jgi:hypothetical protein